MESWIARKGFEANVHCNSCSATVYTITYDFEEQAEKNAIEQWNRREPMDKIVEQLEVEVERARTHGLCITDRRNIMQGLLKAIEIVKGGAV